MSEFWNKCLDILRQQHAQAVFQTWFADLKADDTGLEDGVLTLIADSSQKSRMTQESYGKAIAGIVNQVAGRNIDITWTVEQAPEATPPDPVTPPAPAVNTTEQSGLLPNLTFENLVLGSANQLAFAAASQVATNPAPNTTRFSSTAASASAKPISCTPSVTVFLKRIPMLACAASRLSST